MWFQNFSIQIWSDTARAVRQWPFQQQIAVHRYKYSHWVRKPSAVRNNVYRARRPMRWF